MIRRRQMVLLMAQSTSVSQVQDLGLRLPFSIMVGTLPGVESMKTIYCQMFRGILTVLQWIQYSKELLPTSPKLKAKQEETTIAMT